MPSSSSSSSLFSKSALGSAFSSSPSPSPATSSDHALPVLPHSTQPQHVRLNLSIQQFIESFRQLTPSSPSSPSSSISSLTSSNHLNGSGILGTGPPSTSMTLTHALSAAQGLHAEAKKLPAEDRAVYLQEIKDVGALFAYSEPETSILKGFLEQGRRIALAEQVNRAILCEWNWLSSLDVGRRTLRYWHGRKSSAALYSTLRRSLSISAKWRAEAHDRFRTSFDVQPARSLHSPNLRHICHHESEGVGYDSTMDRRGWRGQAAPGDGE